MGGRRIDAEPRKGGLELRAGAGAAFTQHPGCFRQSLRRHLRQRRPGMRRPHHQHQPVAGVGHDPPLLHRRSLHRRTTTRMSRREQGYGLPCTEDSDGSIRLENFRDRDHFIHSYPFIPYQFALFQSAH